MFKIKREYKTRKVIQTIKQEEYLQGQKTAQRGLVQRDKEEVRYETCICIGFF